MEVAAMSLLIEGGGLRLEVRGLAGLLTLAAIGCAAAAVIDQLRRPPVERTWHGKVADAVPYDFRPPTFERALRTLWNPDTERVLSDKLFGVGWDVNLRAAAKKLGLVD
jgi:hypothetical protein